MKDIMIDIETLGDEPGCAIIGIAAVRFDMERGKIGEFFHQRVSIGSNLLYNLTINPKTLEWWGQQDELARKVAFTGNTHIVTSLNKLTELCNCIPDCIVWGNSNRFDLGILAHAYKVVLNQDIPWKFWNERDVRTLASLAPEIKENAVFEGIRHNPVDDCLHQIKYCAATWQKLKK